jgi:NADPH:quinone reductase-like Zn-dependent oxidoreductase
VFEHTQFSVTRDIIRCMIKALRIHQFGNHDVVKWEDISKPIMADGQLRIEVKAGALNRLDIWVREELPGIPVNLPFVQGSDVSGVVTEIAKDVKGFEIGDRVVMMPNYGCGHCKHCNKGQIHICPQHGFYGETRDGNFADEIVRPAQQFFKIPDNLSFAEAACIPVVALTAWEMLKVKAKVCEDETVFVCGASSGVGTMAIQISKLLGAKVIALTSGEENCKKVLSLGADHVIDRLQNSHFAKEVKSLTNKMGADVIFEHSGEKTFDQSFRCLAAGGRMVVCGATTGHEMKLDARFLFVKQWQILGSSMGRHDYVPEILSHFASGELKSIVGLEMSMKDGAEAQRILVEESVFGKIVLINN